MSHNLPDALKQTDVKAFFAQHGAGPWTVVYKDFEGEGHSGGLFAALAPRKYRATALERESWDLTKGDGLPGFIQSYRGGRRRTTYLRFGDTTGVEPIVIRQEHYGIKPSQLHISEEFRLFHNLWVDERRGRLIKIADDGTESVAAEIKSDEVKIRTPLLRMYQAARQLDLLLFIDSIRSLPGIDDELDVDGFLTTETSESGRSVFAVGTLDYEPETFSRYLAKKVIFAPVREHAGVWPYERKEQDFPEFIVGEDELGAPIRSTCDPDQLRDNFGGNTTVAHYLTPVFFRREVLQRYYEQPEKFSVDGSRLRCGGLWSLQIDTDRRDVVMVFLGDLGRDLPESERGYWRTFSVPPTGQMSETAFRRNFLNQFVEPQAVDTRFKAAYGRFRIAWKALGWDLFKELEAADEHVFKRLRVPLVESQPEFEDQILNLTKLMVDAINERQVSRRLPTKVEDEKGIAKLERWLQQEGYAEVARDVTYLRKLQRLRSRIAAHRKGSDYDDFFTAEIGDQNFSEAIAALLESGIEMMDGLSAHFVTTAE